MISHNYDGDMLTDEISQVHGSPGFITSNLTGKREDGTLVTKNRKFSKCCTNNGI
jgi:isocitrate dehydrogenase